MSQSVSYDTALPTVPVTEERPPFKPAAGDNINYGTACANAAITKEFPHGSLKWANKHKDKTVLQQHCEFFDRDGDGVLWPWDTYIGFYRLGFGVILSILALFIIHAGFSYPTCPSFFPDPFFRIYLARIHKDKHGSDSGTYDGEGRFIPQRFEDAISKYGKGKDGLSSWDIIDMLKGQRVVMDPFGWSGGMFEWVATYIMLWPEDGVMRKDDIRRVYDGSIFHDIAAKREQRKIA